MRAWFRKRRGGHLSPAKAPELPVSDRLPEPTPPAGGDEVGFDRHWERVRGIVAERPGETSWTPEGQSLFSSLDQEKGDT